ncbi:MAG: MATE family efflux transporter [Dehalococcoidales bacterium]|nr:MATE family efflux transporter [Dehalococcoidales bacterium]
MTTQPKNENSSSSVTAKANHNSKLNRDWTQGSISGNLLTLAWPIIISSSLNMLGPTFDAIWVGRLGADAVAGVGVAGIIVGVVNSILMGIFSGMGALISRSIGAGDKEAAVNAARQGFVVGIFLSILMAVIGTFFSGHLLRMLGLQPDVVALGAAYLSIQFIGMVSMVFEWLTNTIMQASGDTMNPMRIALVARLFAIALSPCLVFGVWIFPKMGVRGPAVAGVITFAIGGAIGLWLLLSQRSRLKIDFKGFRPDFKIIGKMVKIGLPAAINGAQMSVVGLVVMDVVAKFGTVAVAANTIVSRVEGVIYMPGMGLGNAAGVLAGQNLGAQKPERAEKSGWTAAGLVVIGMLVFCSVLLLWANPIVRIFSNDPDVIHIGGNFLRIACVGYMIVGVSLVLPACLNGAGDTFIPMIAGIVSMWGAQIPLAYTLPNIHGLGVYGIRWAIVAAVWIRALTYIFYFRGGRWKRRKV